MRFGTGIGAVFVFLSGGGRGTPGGGSGCPRPMTRGREGLCAPSAKASGACPCRCRCIAFHPHFLAVSAALDTAARDSRFASGVNDLTDDKVELVSRLESNPNEPKNFVDGASDRNDAVLILAGLGGYEDSFEKPFESLTISDTLVEGCGVKSFCKSFSDATEARGDVDGRLPSLSIIEGCEGDPTGV